MNKDKIEELDVVLKHDPGKKIKDFKTTRLTAAGENYGSLIMRLEVKLVDEKTKEEENLDLVAKMLPPNEMLRKIFNVQVTTKNELGFYRDIVPVLEEFQRQHGAGEIVDIFPKYYGGRISLDPTSDLVDEDAILILENLKPQGFTTINKNVGFDLECAKFLVKNLAYFHAVPLALKLKKPDVFEKKVKPHLADFDFSKTNVNRVIADLAEVIKENDTCLAYLDRIKEILRKGTQKIVHEPFATILHNDYWVNNVMLKFENGKPVANRIVDFQVIEYKCPCRDLYFFLFSSVQQKVLEEHLDSLLDLYYESFIEKLEEFKCDITPFAREAFDKQLKLAAVEAEFFHTTAMLFPINSDPHSVKELSDMTPEDFSKRKWVPNKTLKDKLLYITLEHIRRGWLD